MGNPPEQDEADPEDYSFHIEELRKLVEEAPPGYQAKFARVIASLNQRRLRRITEIKHLTASGDVNYQQLLKVLQSELETARDPSARFNVALEIAKKREATQQHRNGQMSEFRNNPESRDNEEKPNNLDEGKIDLDKIVIFPDGARTKEGKK